MEIHTAKLLVHVKWLETRRDRETISTIHGHVDGILRWVLLILLTFVIRLFIEYLHKNEISSHRTCYLLLEWWWWWWKYLKRMCDVECLAGEHASTSTQTDTPFIISGKWCIIYRSQIRRLKQEPPVLCTKKMKQPKEAGNF